MKILSIREPWISCIVFFGKRIENRTWSTKHTGKLGLHKSMWKPRKHEIESAADAAGVSVEELVGAMKRLPHGHVVATCELVGMVEWSNNPWHIEGQTGWWLDRVRRIKPLEKKGRLGLFS